MWSLLLALARSELWYISTSAFVCQELFSSFFKFLSDPLSFVPLSRQLPYIITSFMICQYLFSGKLLLFWSSIYMLGFIGPGILFWRFQPIMPPFLLDDTSFTPGCVVSMGSEIWSWICNCVIAWFHLLYGLLFYCAAFSHLDSGRTLPELGRIQDGCVFRFMDMHSVSWMNIRLRVWYRFRRKR